MRFILIFAVILLFMFTLELSIPIQDTVIIPFTEAIAQMSATLMQLFDHQVIFHGVELIDSQSGFSVSIQAGCNGVEAALILVAAILAYPTSWKAKVIGVFVGFLSVQALNILRIISLFYLGKWNTQAFEWAHLYIWQTLIMLDVLIVFLVWLKFSPRVFKS